MYSPLKGLSLVLMPQEPLQSGSPEAPTGPRFPATKAAESSN